MENGESQEINIFQDLLNTFQESCIDINKDTSNQEILIKKNEFPSHKQFIIPDVPEMEAIYKNIMSIGIMYKDIILLLEKHNQSMVAEGLLKVVRNYLHVSSRQVAEISTQKSLIKKCAPREDCASLRWALVWSRNFSTPLQFMKTILSETQNHSGSDILGVLSMYLPHGSKNLSGLAHELFQGAAESFCKMVWNWLVMGALKDPYNEFFITKNESYSNSDSWDKKFLLRKALTPNVLPMGSAKLILDCGKMISFILEYFEDMKPDCKTRRELSEHQRKPFCGLFELLTENKAILHNKIEDLYWSYSEHILTILKDVFNLKRYFKGVYWYIFLTLGSFGRHFLELIYPLYYSDAEYLDIHAIKDLLRNVVISTSPFQKNMEKLKEAEYVIGNWKHLVKCDRLCDVLQINYDRGSPINKIFSSFEVEHFEINLIIWKLQHIQYSLSLQRRVLLHLIKTISFKGKMEENWEMMFLLIATMGQFINQVNFFIMNDIIEAEWKEFWDQYSQARTIDTVINLYGRMLRNILFKLSETRNKEMSIGLNIFHRLTIDSEQLVDEMEQLIIQNNGFIFTDELNVKIIILNKIFQNEVQALLKRVMSNNNKECLMYFCERINFNEYYQAM